MSWWERQYKKYVVNGLDGVVTDDALANDIQATSTLTVEALGPVLVTYAGEQVIADGDVVYVQTR